MLCSYLHYNEFIWNLITLKTSRKILEMWKPLFWLIHQNLLDKKSTMSISHNIWLKVESLVLLKKVWLLIHTLQLQLIGTWNIINISQQEYTKAPSIPVSVVKGLSLKLNGSFHIYCSKCEFFVFTVYQILRCGLLARYVTSQSVTTVYTSVMLKHEASSAHTLFWSFWWGRKSMCHFKDFYVVHSDTQENVYFFMLNLWTTMSTEKLTLHKWHVEQNTLYLQSN